MRRRWIVAGGALVGATVLALAWGAMSPVQGDDQLIGEARSPDGRLVARLWCPDLCDVPEKIVLTISPPTRDVRLKPRDSGGSIGSMPDDDIRMTTWTSLRAEPPYSIAFDPRFGSYVWWASRGLVAVRTPCPADGRLKLGAEFLPGKPTIRLVDSAPPGECNFLA